MTNEYEMQNFWRFEIQKNEKEQIKDDNYCYYSDLPSPLAYIDLKDDEIINLDGEWHKLAEKLIKEAEEEEDNKD